MIFISIVTYNSRYLDLKPTLESIMKLSISYTLFIVDNSPTDILRNELRNYDHEYIYNNSNLGFGAAHNIAIKKAQELGIKYHFIINPDIYFDPRTIESIVNIMDQNPDIGLLMPRILYPDGSLQYLPKLLPSPFDLLIRRFGLFRRLFSNKLNNYELRGHSSSKTFNTPIISGCFSCLRVSIVENVGLYDERFFMYFEDFDFSRRINKSYKTIYHANVSVYHKYERGAQRSSKLFRIFVISAIKYFNKWGWFMDSDRKNINKKTLEQF